MRTSRHASGKGSRATTGGGEASAPRPPSTISPPSVKARRPTPERFPRSRALEKASGEKGRPASRARATATARASCVPDPNPAWAGIALSTRMETPVPTSRWPAAAAA